MSDSKFPGAKQSGWEDFTSGLFCCVFTTQLASLFPLEYQIQLIGSNNASMAISREHACNVIHASVNWLLHSPLKTTSTVMTCLYEVPLVLGVLCKARTKWTHVGPVVLCICLSACLNSRTGRQILMEPDVDILQLEATGFAVLISHNM
jgi:hypothetical protein